MLITTKYGAYKLTANWNKKKPNLTAEKMSVYGAQLYLDGVGMPNHRNTDEVDKVRFLIESEYEFQHDITC